MKTFLTGLLAVVVIALVGFTWWQTQEIHTLETTAAANADDRAKLTQRAEAAEKSLAETAQRLTEADTKRTDLEARLKTLAQSAAAGGGNSNAARAAAGGQPRDPTAAMMAMFDNPAMMRVMQATVKGQLDGRYAALFRKLQLSPAELDKFKDLISEKSVSGLDVIRSAQTQGIDLKKNPEEIAKLMGSVQGELDDSIRSLIGDARYAQYKDFNQNMASYGLYDQIDRRLSFTNAPLKESQSDALVKIIGETTQPTPMEKALAGPGAAMAGFAQGMAGMNPAMSAMSQRAITDQTITAAQGVLSAPQIEALRQLQAEQKAQASLMSNLGSSLGGRNMTMPAQLPAPAPTH